jgi:hypothetical protein
VPSKPTRRDRFAHNIRQIVTTRCGKHNSTAPSAHSTLGRSCHQPGDDPNGDHILTRRTDMFCASVIAASNGVNAMTGLPYIVFDVNETLLDLETMSPTFERIFGDKRAMRLWFANLILYSAALTVANSYVPFTDIGGAVMKMLADVRGVRVGDGDRQELTDKFSTMPPHPEVPAALRKLRGAGFRLIRSLTISSRCRSASSGRAASSISSSGASAPTACIATSRRRRPTPLSRGSLTLSLPTSA